MVFLNIDYGFYKSIDCYAYINTYVQICIENKDTYAFGFRITDLFYAFMLFNNIFFCFWT